MKLFISYSTQNYEWVYEFWYKLRDKTAHDVWIDQKLVPAVNWWHSILENIEKCDCLVLVMSPDSVKSIFCLAELDYALALNRPVLPIMLKPCDVPPQLLERNIQHLNVSKGMPIDTVLLKVLEGLAEVRVALVQGLYPPRKVERPSVPIPKSKSELQEVYALREDPVGTDNLALLRLVLDQLIARGITELGQDTARQLEILLGQTQVKLPDEATGATSKIHPASNPMDTGKIPIKPPPPLRRIVHPSHKVIPPPFNWVEIPEGYVTLYTWDSWEDNYVSRSSRGHVFALRNYAISRYPITNGQFKRFTEAGGYEQARWWTPVGWQEREKRGWKHPRYFDESKWNDDRKPVVGVSWYEAVAFCLWLSEVSGETIMLPSEQQWQFAAQGSGKNPYPWGSLWNCLNANSSVSPCHSDGTTEVTAYEQKGSSRLGAADMVGNVWEWCRTDYRTGTQALDHKIERLARGGSWVSKASTELQTIFRRWYRPQDASRDLGFRIVRNYHPLDENNHKA